jgi:hypothetical protein
MKKLVGLTALALALTFGTASFTHTFASDPQPTEEKDKKNPSGPKFNSGDDKKDEKKDDKDKKGK